MTALAGFIASDDTAPAAALCERMLRSQSTYAPDRPVLWSSPRAALGRRLFKLLPEDVHDRGPVIADDGGRVLVADLRLDNRAELCELLGVPAAMAGARSDAQILMQALDRWGADAVHRLAGPFAFALWSPRERQLLLARDAFGERPLHFSRSADFVAFASMPKGLHALPQLPPAPNARAVAEFVALMPQSSRETFFAGVEKVPGGHLVFLTGGQIAVRKYWDPRPVELRLRRPSDYEDALREQLDRAVGATLRGCRGVAAHLSGGLDSSSVSATAAQLLLPAGGTVRAYTAVPREGFAGKVPPNTFADEGPLAEDVSRAHSNIEHVAIPSTSKSPLDDLDRFYALFDGPVLNLCNSVWMFAILDEARRRGDRVLLTGQAGNLTISYSGLALLPQLLRCGRLVALAAIAAKLVANGTRVGTVAAQTIGPFLPEALWQAVARARGKSRRLTDYTAINPSRIDDLQAAARERGLDFGYRPRQDPLEQRLWTLQRWDMGNHNKGILGGWGIDTRDPTADRRLVEFCLSLPAREFLRGGVPRSLIRRAMRDRLPESVLREKRKGYQAADWFEGAAAARGQIGEELERLGNVPDAAQTLDLPQMRRLVEQWPQDRWHEAETVARYRHALLRGVSAGHFLRKASGANG